MNLQAYLLDYGIQAEQALQMERYATLLQEANEQFNLTRIVCEEDMAKKHFADSLTPMNKGIIRVGDKVLDIGTGAGFPAVPLAIMGAQVTALDSSRKKIDFVAKATKELDIPIRTQAVRAEELARLSGHRQRYDVVVARAVARLHILMELSAAFVRVGGHFIAYKGASAQDEVEEAKSAAKLLGFDEAKVVHSGLPDLDHRMVIYKKIRPTDPQYPRAFGQIKKRPL